MSVVLTTLREQEEIVERGLASFVEVGNALMRIREEELYREAGFDGFADYLEAKPWGIGANAAYKQIQAAEVAAICTTVQTESQARELAPLMRKATPEVVQQVYAEVVQETNGKPTAARIREKVREILPPKKRKSTRKKGGESAARVLPDYVDPAAKDNPRTQLVEWFNQGRLVNQLLQDGGKIVARSEEDREALLHDAGETIRLAQSIKRRLR